MNARPASSLNTAGTVVPSGMDLSAEAWRTHPTSPAAHRRNRTTSSVSSGSGYASIAFELCPPAPVAVRRLRLITQSTPIRAHYRRALRRGWPRILIVNRAGSDARRDRLLQDLPTRPGFDRDEYPPAVGRGTGRPALTRGTMPTGWKASVAYVPSSENRSHGSLLGRALRRFCNGTRFKYAFT